MKAILRMKFTALNAYIRKIVKSKINNLTFHLRKLDKEPIKSKESRRKEIIKIRAEISDTENRKSTQKNQQKPKVSSSKRSIKLKNLNTRLIKKKKKRDKLLMSEVKEGSQ